MLVPSICAYEYNFNTTVTVDWIGNNQFYLRTEAGDFLLDANETAQVDSSYALNLSRHTQGNATDLELILSHIGNMSNIIQNLSQDENHSRARCVELDANWTRCNLDKNKLLEESLEYESVKSSYLENITSLMQARQVQIGVFDDCQKQLMNKTENEPIYKKKIQDNLMLGLVIGGALVGGIMYMYGENQKKHSRPKQMRNMGYSGSNNPPEY